MKKDSFIPVVDSTALIFIDMQEKLLGAMPADISETITHQKILLESAKLLDLKVVVTEQYPRGLGSTVMELSSLFSPDWPVIEKNAFSSLGESAVRMKLQEQNLKTVVLAGIETHVCVLQTAIDSIEKGYQTIILADAVNSRKRADRETALRTAEAAGAIPMTVESVIFMLMRDSKHHAFRSVSKLLR